MDKDEVRQKRRAWENSGAYDVKIQILPMRMHTESGLRVEIAALSISGANPELVGTLFREGGQVEMRWSVRGSVYGDSNIGEAIDQEYGDELGALAAVAARFYP